MKDIVQIGHQGDTQWYSIKEIPSKAKKIEKRFLASSEKTGSLHALFGNYDMYEVEDMDNCFVLDVKEECILNHSLQKDITCSLNETRILPKKDHRHSIIKEGLYMVGIQNRFDPLENTKKKVQD